MNQNFELVHLIDLWIAIPTIINIFVRLWIENKRSHGNECANKIKFIKAFQLLMVDNLFCKTNQIEFDARQLCLKTTLLQENALKFNCQLFDFNKRFDSHSERLSAMDIER